MILGFPYQRSALPANALAELDHFIAEQVKQAALIGNQHASELLENQLSKMFGVEAALWLPTGILAQGIAARIHTQTSNNRSVLLHPSSHLLLYESEGYTLAHDCKAIVMQRCWQKPFVTLNLSRQSPQYRTPIYFT